MMLKGRYLAGRTSCLTLYNSTSSAFSSKSNLYNSTRRPSLLPLSPTPSQPEEIEPPSPHEAKPKQSAFTAEPVSDLEELGVLKMTSQGSVSRPDLELPKLPDLTGPIGELFDKKVTLCCAVCDFDKVEMDIEAKEIKRKTLEELLMCYSDLTVAKTIGKERNNSVMAMCARNVFRSFPAVPMKHLAFGDEPKIIESKMPHLSIVYLIMGKMIGNPQIEFDLEPNLGAQLCGNLHSPDLSEREMVSDVLYLYYQANENQKRRILWRIAGQLSYYRSYPDIAAPFCVWPSLLLLVRVYRASMPMLSQEQATYFWEHVVPLLTARHLTTFMPALRQLSDIVVSINSSWVRSLTVYCLHQYPIICANKQCCFVEMLNGLIEKLRLHDFADLCVAIFRLYAQCAVSDNAKVAEMSMRIWSSPDLIPKILDNAKAIFPVYHESIVRSSKEHWNTVVQNKALAVLKSMRDINPFLFEELSSGVAKPPGRGGQQKAWAMIARTACRNDRCIDLAGILGEIQMRFNNGLPLASVSSVGYTGNTGSNKPRIVNPLRKNENNVWR